MRLAEDQVRSFLNHSEKPVRNAALEYFARSYSRNPAIMLDVIDAIERFGATEAFEYPVFFTNLAQTPAGIGWVVGQLRQFESPPAGSERRQLARNLRRLLVEADPQAVAPHREAILSLPGLPFQAALRLNRRFDLESTPGERLWRRLEEIAEAGKSKHRRKDIEGSEAKAIIAVLARDATNADRISDLLLREYDSDVETPMTWLEIFAVRMAGEMRYEPAIPLLIEKLKCGGMALLDETGEALRKIGTDSVVQAVYDEFLTADEDFRTYSMSIFGQIHSDAAVAAGLDLLRRMDPAGGTEVDVDKDLDFDEIEEDRDWLASEMVLQMSTEVIDACREVLLTAPKYVAYDLQVDLVTACKLTGYLVPELKRWEKELADPDRYFQSEFDDSDLDDDADAESEDADGFSDDELSDEFDETASVGLAPFADFEDPEDQPEILTRAAPVGRNDPCPCGSGKKYKKCCMRDNPLP